MPQRRHPDRAPPWRKPLLGRRSADVAPVPFIQDDWPSLPTYQRSYGADVVANLLLTTLAVAIVTLLPRAPVYTVPQRPAQVFAHVVPNLLTSTLAGAAQTPFSQKDWPTPQQLRYQPQDVPPNITRAVPGASPFSQLDWQATQRLDWQRADDVQNSFALLNTVQAASPVPRAPAFNQVQRPRYQPQDTLPGAIRSVTAAPFSQQDWFSPLRPEARQAVQPTNLLPLAPPGQKPFAQLDWQTTQWQRWQQSDVVQASFALLNTAPPAPAAVIFREPVFVQVQKHRFQPPFQAPTIIPPPVVAGTPFAQVEWVRLQRPKAVEFETPPNLLTSTLAVQYQPFSFDWQELSLRKPGTSPDLPQNLTLLQTPQAVPFHQTDWTVVQRPLDGRKAYGESSSLALLATPAQVPFAQYDWNVVERPLDGRKADGVSSSLALLATPAQVPFTPVDWPNVSRLLYSFTPAPLQVGLLEGTLTPPAAPNLHKLYFDISSGRLFIRVSVTANPTLIEPL